jgi:predicted AlkP superfamily pyrophosphatase or phosphodiesterase
MREALKVLSHSTEYRLTKKECKSGGIPVMSDEVPSESGTAKAFFKPRYDGYSIANIPETVAKLLGVRATRPLVDEKLSSYAGTEHVVFLLLDGFGAAQLKFAREHYGVPSFERLFSKADHLGITSVFPSTTSSAMSSLHTGLTPQEHGVIGYTMFVSQLGAITQMLRFTPVLGGRSVFDSGLDPASFLNARTIHERLTDGGVSSTVYTPSHILDSGLSRITYRGAEVAPSFSFTDSVIRARKNLEKDRGTSFHFVYYASLDTVSHARGPYTEVFAAELEALFSVISKQLFSKLNKKIAMKTTLLVSGDHGATRVRRESILDVADHPELTSNFRLPPTGDSRASIFNLKPGTRDKVRSFFEEKFPGQFEVRDSPQLLAEGYYGLGMVKEETPGRIGDLVALAKINNAIDNSAIEFKKGEIPGRHGGLSEEEIQVPLIATKLAS